MDNDLAAQVRAAQDGDTEALEWVLSSIAPSVVRRCAKLLPYRQDAEEAAQDALMSIATHLGSFSGRGSFEGWVTVIASNAARQTYRSMRRRFAEQSHETSAEVVDPRTTSVIAGSRLDLLDAIEALENRHPEVIEAFILRDVGGMPYSDVATLTSVPLGTAKARIHTARSFMRERMVVVTDNFLKDPRI